MQNLVLRVPLNWNLPPQALLSLRNPLMLIVSSLPLFVRTNWVSRFLPTLYHRFGSSEEPWKLFTKGDEMLSIIQELIKAVYPDNNTYRARWGDKICAAVLISLFLKTQLLTLS